MAEHKIATETFAEATAPLLVEGELVEEPKQNNKAEATATSAPNYNAPTIPKGTVTGRPVAGHLTDNVPPGAEPGGVWGTYKYIGGTSGAVACLGCLCLGIPALLVLLCPLDQRDAYKVNGRIYDPEGKYLGSNTHHFIAKMGR